MLVHIHIVGSVAAVLFGICIIVTTCQQYSSCHPYACEFGECISKSGSFLCKCDEAHVGPTCNIRRSPLLNCHINGPHACFNGGLCNTTANNYRCICPSNFTGSFCEEDVNECSTSPCKNGGTCVNRIGSYYCICPRGFKGASCIERTVMCNAVTCLNGGSCIDSTDGYVCKCARGYFGTRCQYAEQGISRESSNRIANKLGNAAVNDFVLTLSRKPFTSCPNSSHCSRVFRNSVCNKECNVETCMFDGFDCISEISHCPDHISAYCKERRGNNICDEACNQIACDYDGGDCNPTFSNILRGEILMVVLTNPLLFVSNLSRFLSFISHLLRADVRIKRDEIGLMVYSWNNGEIGQRIMMDVSLHFSNLYNTTEEQGVLVKIEIDVSRCEDECFSDIEVVANFIENARDEFTELGMPIYSAVAKIPSKRTLWTILLIVITACFAVIIFFVVFLTVYERSSRKRKIIESAAVWIPPTEFERDEKQKQSNEEGLQYASLLANGKPDTKSSRRSSLSQSMTRLFVLPKLTTVQSKPSRLYIESASAHPISHPLTAKEVNQRGPYGRTPLMILAKNTVRTEEQLIIDVTKLHDVGADMNLFDDYGDTALHMAVLSGRIALVRKLLQLGASPVIRDNSNSTCLHLAARACASDMIAALLEVEEMRKEVDAIDNSNRTALMLVAMHDRVDSQAARMLIEAGAKVDYDGDNTFASWRGRTALHFAAKYDNAQMVAFLLQVMADENCQDYEHCTPLHLAAAEGHMGPVKELLKAGANVLLRNDRSQTAYDMALLNNSHSVAALLASGDNLRVQLYSNHGEIVASAPSPTFKHVKILSTNRKSSLGHIPRKSTGCTQSTVLSNQCDSTFSSYSRLTTPYSAAVCGITTPSYECSGVVPAHSVSSGSTTQPVQLVQYPTCYNRDVDNLSIPCNIVSSPHYEEVGQCYKTSEKQIGRSGISDSGFVASPDIGKQDCYASYHPSARFTIPKHYSGATSQQYVPFQEFIV